MFKQRPIWPYTRAKSAAMRSLFCLSAATHCPCRDRPSHAATSQGLSSHGSCTRQNCPTRSRDPAATAILPQPAAPRVLGECIPEKCACTSKWSFKQISLGMLHFIREKDRHFIRNCFSHGGCKKTGPNNSTLFRSHNHGREAVNSAQGQLCKMLMRKSFHQVLKGL